MDAHAEEYSCPKQLSVKVPPHHQGIITKAVRSGRYGNASEFFRESIEVNGVRRGFTPADDMLSPAPEKDHTCPRGEQCRVEQ